VGNFLTSCKPVSCSRRTLHRGVSRIRVKSKSTLLPLTHVFMVFRGRSLLFNFRYCVCYCRSQWPCGLGRGSAAACLLVLWVPIQPGAWMSVCRECCLLSGTALCVGLITRPEDSYRVCCVSECDHESSIMRTESLTSAEDNTRLDSH